MSEEHVHTTNIRSANNKIVCSGCVSKEDKHANECFCDCHKSLKDQCLGCTNFHRS